MRRLLYLLALTALHQPAAAETILVSEDSPSGPLFEWPLWHAIDAASPGDTIRVAAGEYMGGLRIDKPLTLLGAGADSTIVFEDYTGYTSVFVITAEAVTIEGFYLLSRYSDAVACRGCSAMLRHNIIEGRSPIWITGDSRLTINYNELRHGIELRYNSHPVDARFNWWGTTG